MGGAENNTELAVVEPLMEEVEVEGFKEKKHCTTVARTGTRMTRKICRTTSETKQEREASRSWMNKIMETNDRGVTAPLDAEG